MVVNIYDIKYDFTEEDICFFLEQTSQDELLALNWFPKFLGKNGHTAQSFFSMSFEEQVDTLYDAVHHNLIIETLIFNMPDSFTIDIGDLPIGDEDTNSYITEWITNTTGYCVTGWHYEYER